MEMFFSLGCPRVIPTGWFPQGFETVLLIFAERLPQTNFPFHLPGSPGSHLQPTRFQLACTGHLKWEGQRHHFADQGQHFHSYGFSRSHAPVSELACKAERWRIDAFELWCWRRLSRSPWDCKEIEPVHPKGNQPWTFVGRTDAEAPILRPPDAMSQLVGKDPDAGKDWRQEEKGMTEDEMVGWHHWLNGHEFEQTPGVADGQVSLACCSPLGRKESDTTEDGTARDVAFLGLISVPHKCLVRMAEMSFLQCLIPQSCGFFQATFFSL